MPQTIIYVKNKPSSNENIIANFLRHDSIQQKRYYKKDKESIRGEYHLTASPFAAIAAWSASATRMCPFFSI
jgi:hypothetical protein